jgi:hypothetical protein
VDAILRTGDDDNDDHERFRQRLTVALDLVRRAMETPATARQATSRFPEDRGAAGAIAPRAVARQHSVRGQLRRGQGMSDSRTAFIAAISKHHRYSEGGAANPTPINCKLLIGLGFAKQTVSKFFKTEFGGYKNYKRQCLNQGKLIAALKLLNGEFSPRLLDRPEAIADRDTED